VLILIVLIHIHTCIALSVLSVHTVFYIYFCTRIPVSASEPRCSYLSACYIPDFRIYNFNASVLMHLHSQDVTSGHC